ncbi:MAG: formyltetrahydrofolate deformylase [Prevotellaceae bacterium]|jgi:formyltetrahydrofolate deformylase|nr:formyltetrahydrofolate deformylase [Prevotellaceae bacterium]
MPNTAILLMHCPDRQGIVANIAKFLSENSGNVLYLDQHVDREEKQFFMRVEWDLDNFSIPQEKVSDYFETLIAKKYGATFSIYFTRQRPRMAIFVSGMSHCLYDMLARHSAGEWHVDVPLIVSNHSSMAAVAKQFDIPYYSFCVTAQSKDEEEKKQLALLKEHNINFVVLARYMQVLSDAFIRHYPNKIINIHHSFLPAFAGAKPYHASYERGVKIIGATSHYVTADLDAGPIIEQDVVRVTHKDAVDDLVQKGRDLEKIVLSRAVFAHLQRKVLVYKNKTIVFS